MVRPVRVARSVDPNAGTVRALERELNRLRRQARRKIEADILGDLQRGGFLAQDASLGTTIRQSAQALERMGKFVARKLSEWLRWLWERGEKIAKKFVMRLARDTGNAQKAALLKAGLPKGALNARLTMHIGNLHIAPETAEKLPDFVRDMTALITRTTERDVDRIQGALAEGLAKGQDIKALRETLKTVNGFDARRAYWVALDQSNKINSFIQRENAKSLGITQAIWVHHAGTYTSRKSHVKMNGKRFDLDKGMWDPEVQAFVQPGELPYCRCSCRMVIPDEWKTA